MGIGPRSMLGKVLMMGQGGWTPYSLGNKVDFIFDADKIGGGDGDSISTYTDHAITFTQATGSKQPTLKKGANGINSHNVARFDGGDLLVSSNFASDTKGVIVAVYRLTSSPTDYQTLFGSGDEAGHVAYWICRPYTNAANPKVSFIQSNNDTGDNVRGGTGLVADTPYIVYWQSTGTAYSIVLNGVYETLAVVGGANNGDWLGDTDGRDNFSIGALKYDTETAFFKGDLAYLVVLNDNLTVTESDRLGAWLGARFGVTYTPYGKLMMTFSDGIDDQYNIAFPYMQTRGLLGSAFIVSGEVGNGGYMTAAQLQEMNAAGWDIGNHTDGFTSLVGMTQADAQTAIRNCRTYLEGVSLPRAAYHLNLPNADYDATVQAAADEESIISILQRYTALYPTKTASADVATGDMATLKTNITAAVQAGKHIIFGFHAIEAGAVGANVTPAEFTDLMDWIVAQGYGTLTITQLYAKVR